VKKSGRPPTPAPNISNISLRLGAAVRQ